MISHSDTVTISAELGHARRRFDEAMEHLRDGDFVKARMRLRGTAQRLSRMANILQARGEPMHANGACRERK